MSGYIGNIPVPEATQDRTRFLCLDGQTSFTVPTFHPDYVDVFLNGVKLDTTDYSLPDTETVQLAISTEVDDVVEVISYTTFNAATVTSVAVQGAFWENDTSINASYTITAGKNAGTFGPVTIQDGVVITIPSGSTWTIV